MLQSAHNYDNRVCLTAAGGEDGRRSSVQTNRQAYLTPACKPRLCLWLLRQLLSQRLSQCGVKPTFVGPKRKPKGNFFMPSPLMFFASPSPLPLCHPHSLSTSVRPRWHSSRSIKILRLQPAQHTGTSNGSEAWRSLSLKFDMAQVS